MLHISLFTHFQYIVLSYNPGKSFTWYHLVSMEPSDFVQDTATVSWELGIWVT